MFVIRYLAVLASFVLEVERVMTENGAGCRSRELDATFAAEGVRRVYTRPYNAWQNGVVERMSRTLAQEWQYGCAWESEAGRRDALPAYLEHYNWGRQNSAGDSRPCRAPSA